MFKGNYLNVGFRGNRTVEALDNIRNGIASCLNEGATSRRFALHTPVVVTPAADARVMV